MSLIPVEDGQDVWLRESEACERLCTEINSQIMERNREAPSSARYQQISAAIRVRLNQFNSQAKELRVKLEATQANLTREETERRIRQVEILESRRIKLQAEFMEIGRANMQRQQLMSGSMWQESGDAPSAGAVADYSNQQLVEQRKRILAEQDEGLENLSKIIGRQKDIAVRIHDEVQNQNELLDELGEGMDGVDTRINEEIGHIRQVGRRPSLCGYYLLILGILLVLILVLLLK